MFVALFMNTWETCDRKPIKVGFGYIAQRVSGQAHFYMPCIHLHTLAGRDGRSQ